MKIVLLGTTGYHPNDRRETACMLIPEHGVMFDAGTGMYRAAEYLETPELTILLSHAHLDHVVGLTFLLDVMHAHPMNRVRVFGRADQLAAIDAHLFSETIFPVKIGYEACPLEREIPLPGGGRAIHFPLAHRGGSTGYRLDWPGHSLAYVTDTTASPDAPYVDQIRGVRLLLHECYFSDAENEWAAKTGHSCTSAVAEVAREAGVERLVLVHIDPRQTGDDPIGLDAARAIFPNTELGEDRAELEF